MRRLTVMLLLLHALGLTQAAHAVDLEAGWYVKLFGVSMFGWDGNAFRGTDWSFTGGLGTFGPFDVTSPDPLWAERMVSVPNTVHGVTPGTSVYLWGEPDIPVNYPVSQMSVGYDTLYDALQMRLEVLMYKDGAGFTLLWTQNLSGFRQGWPNVLGEFQVIPVGYVPVFRVLAVPEPSGTPLLLAGLSCTIAAGLVRRWKLGTSALAVALLALVVRVPANALSPHEVLIVYNTREPINLASRAVAEYYASARGIPARNLKGLSCPTAETVTQSDYRDYLATPLSQHLALPENAHIKAIVLCYGVPSNFGSPLFQHQTEGRV